MSWLFGKKKQKESPTDSAEETTSVGPSQPDDYIIIEKQGNPFAPMNPASGSVSSSSGNSLYPYLNDGSMNYPSVPSTIPQQINNNNNQIEQQNYLTGVPFKLSKQFDDDQNNEIERLKIDEIISYYSRVNVDNFNYDFGLEESVINELESTTD
ncbi:uncharacterized protein LOC122848165 [Aphidius gifuensis]|uniref:uncharacterized protein LOC122848165 n=1 Tax=Aphidius gifuensis TaxID=684658 RepID=UPI001CDCB218|nr:uncharacterized protein LOC122848165 [Aphidius gifuensis]